MKRLFNSPLRVTQTFGVNPQDYQPFGLAGHEGLDCVPTDGDWQVYCLEDGIVVKDDDIAGNPKQDAYGINTTVWHPSLNKATQYCHLEYNQTFLNQQIKRGDPIGKMGSTGNTHGAHLHLNLFETDANGVRLHKDNGYLGGTNPLPFLEETVIPSPVPTPAMPITDQTLLPFNLVTLIETYGVLEFGLVKSKFLAKDQEIASSHDRIQKLDEKIDKFVKDSESLMLDFAKYRTEVEKHMTDLGAENLALKNRTLDDFPLSQLFNAILKKIPH